ncbi:MAG: hypothetical protein A3K65_05615 [Euryarchaeota archaeon RBG_16_68_12]|nr:MAG: hypothetical protein A3K65_05615 [Euryarchaeota archaeon RBG_16_68_12]
MLRTVTKQHTRDEVLALLQPLVREWFASKFPGLTEPQAFAVPLIHERKSVLISSPTGSGKTLTAFLSVINELYSMQLRGELEDKIYAAYVSPLKALANDINRNLEEPLREMRELAASKGLPAPEIRVGVRSGDTSAQERQRQARTPPHIFITTPESLTLVLSAPKFRERFSDVMWLVVDEIHEVCGNKRGALLSLTIERLQLLVGKEFTRIGLSATIAPIEEVAKYLAGYVDGKLRDMNVVEVESRKSLDIAVLCPVRDLSEYAMQEANAKMYDLLTDLIQKHRTTLIFTNTRSGTEHVSFKLKEQGIEDLEAHHGSLSKETRIGVEERLKRGDLKAVVCSTSLELGIDIGYIDLVCQIGSPKSIAKGLQRIGRAGHNYGDTSVGRLIVFEPWDLMECATLVKNAYENKIDRVDIVRNPLDVLAQGIIGMSLEKRWEADEAFDLIRRSYAFHDLPKRDFVSVLQYLASRNPDVKVFAKLWYDADEKRFGKKRGTRMIYYTNVGTIPEEGSYHVVSERGSPLGDLSEKFVEYLKPNDIFVLGGRTYQFLRTRGMTVYVKDASGRRPTVPSWTGEMLPRSFDLSVAVGEFRRMLADKIDELGDEATVEWLLKSIRLDPGSARSLVSHVQEQRAVLPDLPTDRQVVVEGTIDDKGNRNVVFHYCFGRRVNDALSRAFAFAVTEKYKTNVRVTVTDDNFMLTIPKRIELDGIEKLVTSKSLEDLLRRAVRNTELFKQRFRHCATRAFMILRNYKGREVSIGRQQLRSQRVLDWLHEIEDFPVVREAYREILNDVMDIHHAKEVLGRIESGELEVKVAGFSNLPSPFAHNAVLAGVSDLVLMEDRSALLRELHKQILRRIVPEAEIEAAQFKEDEVREYFKRKVPKVERKEDLPALIERAGALNLVQQKGPSVFDHSRVPFADLRAWAGELMEAGKVQSVWTPRGVLWAAAEEVPLYAAVYAQKSRPRPEDEAVKKALETGPATLKALARAVKRDSKAVSEVLRKLERAYAVHRRGIEETVFALRPVKRESFETALDRLTTRHLDVHGPTTARELAFVLDLEEEVVKEALRDLEQEGTVASGHFVVGGEYQYMLVHDLQKLRRKDDAREAFGEGQVKAFLLGKQFRGLRTSDDYFDRFMEAGMAFDVFNHVDGFDYEDWLRRRESGEILEGRFLNGRVRYVRAKDAPLFLSAFPRSELTELEAEVLEVVRSNPEGISLTEIAASMRKEREQVREALEKLDYDCYVIRRFQGDGWTTRNLYVPFEVRDDLVEDAAAKVALNFLRAYGPAPLSGVREYAHFPWDEVEALMGRLEEEGKVARILVSGHGEGEMYVLPEELPALRETPEAGATDAVRILSILDPWTQQMWAQYVARWGEGWYFPVVKDGDLVGMAEIWEMSGCLELRELDLNSPEILPQVLVAIDRMMEFYRARGYEIVRVTRVFNKAVPELDTVKPFLQAGYVRLGDFLAKGEIVPTDFEKSQLLAYVFECQGLHPEKAFRDPVAAASALLGLRSDFSARLRISEPDPLERLHRRGDLSRGLGIPDYWTYCTEADLMLFKRAKNAPVTKEMRQGLVVVRQNEPVSRSRLLSLSPLGFTATGRALRKLHEGTHVTRTADNRYRTVKDLKIPVAEARKAVLRRAAESLGVFGAEALANFTRFEFNMGDTRRLLREFEREGWLVKGFFARGERTVYWMLREGLDRVSGLEFHRSFVLTPLDNLFQFLRADITQRWHMGYCYVVFQGTEMVAAFKARRRKYVLQVTEFEGDPEARRVLDEFEATNGLEVGEHVDRISDAEVMEWYSKMYGKGLSSK